MSQQILRSVASDASTKPHSTPPRAGSQGPLAARAAETQIVRLIAHLRAAVLRDPVQRERGHVVFMDAQRRYVGDAEIGTGSISRLILCPRDILSAGFRLGARSMILAHNHPSGDCRPSEDDITATRQLAKLGQMVDLVLLDHLIFTPNATYSMRARGIL
ncbi:MAG: JAB domain-containing protein [Erythrobacter sp.]